MILLNFLCSSEKCSKPQNVVNLASITPDSAEIEVGEKFTVTCTPNYVPNKAELLCQDDGILSPAAECVAGTCSIPDLTDNVESITPDSTIKSGEKFTVKCKPDFVPQHVELTCMTNGVVSSLDYSVECIKGTCSKPALADNVESIIPDSSIKAGEKFTVNCDPNFVPEFVELMCMADGTVSSLDRSPKCIEKGENSFIYDENLLSRSLSLNFAVLLDVGVAFVFAVLFSVDKSSSCKLTLVLRLMLAYILVLRRVRAIDCIGAKKITSVNSSIFRAGNLLLLAIYGL